MAKAISFPYYHLQSDWNEIASKEKIWLNCRNVQDDTFKKTYQLEIKNGSPELVEKNHNDFSFVNYSNKLFIVKDNESQVSHRFLPPIKVFTSIHTKSIIALDVAPTGIAVSSSTDGTMKVWDTLGDVIKLELKGHYSDVYRCRFFPSNEVILSAGSDMLIKIWSAIDGSCPVTLVGHKAAVNDLAIIDRGRNIISVSRDGKAKLWSCAKQSCIEDLIDLSDSPKASINTCAIGRYNDLDLGKRQDPPNENCVGTLDKLLLLGTESGLVYGVGVDSKTSIFNVNCQSPVNALQICQGFNFVTGTDNGNIYEYDLRKTSHPKRFWNLSRSSILDLITLSRPFNGFVASRQDGSVDFLYDNEKEIVHLTGSDCDPIYQVVFDDKFIYTSCRDGKVRKYFLNNAFE